MSLTMYQASLPAFVRMLDICPQYAKTGLT
jgi:hypothetical protein